MIAHLEGAGFFELSLDRILTSFEPEVSEGEDSSPTSAEGKMGTENFRMASDFPSLLAVGVEDTNGWVEATFGKEE